MVTPTLLTTVQYLALGEQYDQHGNRIKDELIGGEIVKVATPSRVHDLIKNAINAALTLFLASRSHLGLLACCEIAYAVTEHDTFVPDVSVLGRQKAFGKSALRILTGSPDIAIEVVSPSDTAEYVKYKISTYLAYGSSSVWMVYPLDRSIVIHTSEGSRELKGDRQIQDPGLPGFSEPVSRFFEGL